MACTGAELGFSNFNVHVHISLVDLISFEAQIQPVYGGIWLFFQWYGFYCSSENIARTVPEPLACGSTL